MRSLVRNIRLVSRGCRAAGAVLILAGGVGLGLQLNSSTSASADSTTTTSTTAATTTSTTAATTTSTTAGATTTSTTSGSTTATTAPCTTPTTTASDLQLLGEGGSFAEPILNALINTDPNITNPCAGGLQNGATYFLNNVQMGEDDLVQGQNDFAVSEFPLDQQDQATATSNKNTYAYVPFAAQAVGIGAIVVCSSGSSLTSSTFCPDLQMTWAQIAELFTGAQTTWTSPTLGSISTQSVSPFSTAIHPCVLIDPSATTYEMTSEFLADQTAGPIWSNYVTEENKAPNALPTPVNPNAPTEIFPTDNGLNDGDITIVSDMIPNNPSTGAPNTNPQFWGQTCNIAPLPADWLPTPLTNVPTVAVQNAAGAYVQPTTAGVQAAMADASFDPTTNLVTFNESTTDTAEYPMVVMSYLVVPTNNLDPAKATATADFIKYALSSAGQQQVTSLGGVSPTPSMISAGMTVASQIAALAGTSSTSSTTSTTAAGSATTTIPGSADTSALADASSSDSPSGSQLALTGSNLIPLVGPGLFLFLFGSLTRRRLKRVAKQ